MTITEFLEARTADDERNLRSGIACGDLFHVSPEQLEAEYEAKRAIVALHPLMTDGTPYRGTPCCARCTANGEYPADDAYTDEQNWPCPTLRAVAAVYADHPDYDQAWSPR